MLINFGSFVAGAQGTAAPYIQLLPLTDPEKAHQDFLNVRVNGQGGSPASSSSGSSASGSPTDSGNPPSSTSHGSGAGRVASSRTVMILGSALLVSGLLSLA
jgi:hypothetical protein